MGQAVVTGWGGGGGGGVEEVAGEGGRGVPGALHHVEGSIRDRQTDVDISIRFSKHFSHRNIWIRLDK